MSWEDKPPAGRNEYMTVGPYRFPHERDAACNRLCTAGSGWYMHSSDVDRRSGAYFAVMARWVEEGENA